MHKVQGKTIEYMGQKETAHYKNGYCQIGNMNDLVIKLEIPKEIADACYRSLEIEAKNKFNRSTIDLKYNDDGLLKIRIKSENLHALRAALNTYLRWVIMCCNLLSNNTTNGTNS